MEKSKTPKSKPYPKSADEYQGCKVGWLYYTNESDAKAASAAAIHNAAIKESQGYDFGFQSPGSIKLVNQGEYAGLYSVCIP